MNQNLISILVSLALGLVTAQAIAEDNDAGASADSPPATSEPAAEPQGDAVPPGSTDTTATDSAVSQSPATEGESK